MTKWRLNWLSRSLCVGMQVADSITLYETHDDNDVRKRQEKKKWFCRTAPQNHLFVPFLHLALWYALGSNPYVPLSVVQYCTVHYVPQMAVPCTCGNEFYRDAGIHNIQQYIKWFIDAHWAPPLCRRILKEFAFLPFLVILAWMAWLRQTVFCGSMDWTLNILKSNGSNTGGQEKSVAPLSTNSAQGGRQAQKRGLTYSGPFPICPMYNQWPGGVLKGVQSWAWIRWSNVVWWCTIAV